MTNLDNHMREVSGNTIRMDAKRDRKLKVMYTNAGQFLNKREDLAFIAGKGANDHNIVGQHFNLLANNVVIVCADHQTLLYELQMS